MSLLYYIINIYIYIAGFICPSKFTNQRLKHKNSEDLGNDDIIVNIHNDDDINDNSYDIGINNDMNRVKYNLKKNIRPKYSCGYCHIHILRPIYMYNDLPFCTTVCRNQQLILDNNNRQTSYSPIVTIQ